MRYIRSLVVFALIGSVGLAVACPEEKADQSKSTRVEKPLAPKPAA